MNTHNIRNSSNVKYVSLLATASVSGFLAGALVWLAEGPTAHNVDLLRIGAAGAGFLAVLLALKAAQGDRNPYSARSERREPSPEKRKAVPAETRTEPAKAEATDIPKLVSATERERERLRNSGFREVEISQILVARETNGNAVKSSFGSGVATGFLNNLDAVVTHARHLMPSFKNDLERLFDSRAEMATRVGGAMALTVKMVALIAIGYFVYLEALQLRSVAYKSWAEACIERQKNAINFTPLNKLISGELTRDLDKECGPQ